MGKLGNLLDRISRPKGDRWIWLIVLVLLSISLIEVFSASSRQTYGKASFMLPFIVHALHAMVGFATIYLCHLFHRFNYRLLSALILLSSLVGLSVLFVRGLHSDNAQRWIDLGVFQFQPSEFAKLAVVLVVAQKLARLDRNDELSQLHVFWKIIGLTALVCVLIVPENLSTTLLIGAVVLVLMIFGGIHWKRMTILIGSLLLLVVLVLTLFITVPPQTIRESKLLPRRTVTWQARILDFFDKDEQYSAVDYARIVAPDKTQETHANIAIATSGIIGKLPGNSNERDYLQEANSDFIFAIIIEEMGMMGALFIMAAYLFLLLRAGRIVTRCKRAGYDQYAYMAAGISLLLVTQAFLNMSVAVGLGPVTGQPLPLISKGGSSMLMSGMGIGILLGISAMLDEPGIPAGQEQQENADNTETETFDC